MKYKVIIEVCDGIVGVYGDARKFDVVLIDFDTEGSSADDEHIVVMKDENDDEVLANCCELELTPLSKMSAQTKAALDSLR